jgi:hypothetical protein
MIADYGLSAPVSTTSARVGYWAARLLLPFIALATGVLLQAPRFGLSSPSLIDEWFAVAYSGSALHALMHGHYLATGSDFQGRYRPGYTAIWNYAQWHLFGHPSLATAMVFGVIRIAAFFLAICVLAGGLAYRALPARRSLVLLAGAAVVFTPQIAVALTRYGPGEPMMVAGIVIGLMIFGIGMRHLLDAGERRRTIAIASIFAGYLIYLLGIYSKESAVALLAFVPFIFMWLRPLLKTAGGRATAAVGIAGVSLIAPLVYLAVRLSAAVFHHRSPWPNAHLTIGQKVYASAVSPFLGVPGVLGTWLWLIACQVAIAGAFIAARRRQREAWLLAGVLVTGFLMSAIPLARGAMATWYYIPWIVAVAAVAFRTLVCANRRVIFLTVLLVALLVPSGTPAALAEWTRTQRSGSEAIDLARTVVAAKCPLYLANFDIEQRVAIPLLFRFGHRRAMPTCAAVTSVAYAVSWNDRSLPTGFERRCRSGWRPLPATDGVGFYQCASLKPAETLDQYEASGEPTVTVVRVRVGRPLPPPADIFQPRPRLKV